MNVKLDTFVTKALCPGMGDKNFLLIHYVN